jgi:hypothetical protein
VEEEGENALEVEEEAQKETEESAEPQSRRAVELRTLAGESQAQRKPALPLQDALPKRTRAGLT